MELIFSLILGRKKIYNLSNLLLDNQEANFCCIKFNYFNINLSFPLNNHQLYQPFCPKKKTEKRNEKWKRRNQQMSKAKNKERVLQKNKKEQGRVKERPRECKTKLFFKLGTNGESSTRNATRC
jgi:hypothetical protein